MPAQPAWAKLRFACAMAAAPAAFAQPSDVPRDMPPKPPCISYSLKQDRLLTFRQKTCYWTNNELFSPSAVLGAAWSAGYSQSTERASDRGKGVAGFATRFGTNYGQSATKSTAIYLTRFILREDPRRTPPYVERPQLKGFWPRLGRAVKSNFVTYRCVAPCEPGKSEVKATFALSRVAGSFASGYSSMLWAPDRLNSQGRSLRRTASAYGGTFTSSIMAEFQPEIGRYAGLVVGKLFGGW